MDAAQSWNPAVAAGTDDDFLPPPPAIGFMPFRPENRMTTLLVCAVLLLCALAVTGVRFILVYPSANSTPAWVFLGASVVLSLKIVLAMLQTEYSRRDLKAEMHRTADVLTEDSKRTRHDLRDAMGKTTDIIQIAASEMLKKTNGGLTEAVKEVGEQVRQAEREQVIIEVLHRQEFRELLAAISADAVRRACEEMVKSAKQQ